MTKSMKARLEDRLYYGQDGDLECLAPLDRSAAGDVVDAILAELDTAGFAIVAKSDLILSPETIRILGALASGGRPPENRVTTSAKAILAAQKHFHETVHGPRPGHD